MASFDGDAAPVPAVKDTGKVAFRFCPECANMLTPREDRSNDTLIFECQMCHHVEKALTACIYRNSLKEDIAETPGNTDDVLEDPTVGALDPPSLEALHVSDDVDLDEDMDEAMREAHFEEVEPSLCTMCGEEILCPTCGRPTDRFLAYEVKDPDAASSADVQAEAEERELSGTLPWTDEVECRKCKHHGAVFFQSQQRNAETGMALFYVCESCKNVWSTLDDVKK